MQVLLNCYLIAFLEFEWIIQKRPNDNLMILTCVITLASYIAWGKLYSLGDISPCFY